jgi:hypothetical protein
MTSSKKPTAEKLKLFNQEQYNNAFSCCDKEHPFVAFTTCFCPMCDVIREHGKATGECQEAEDALDNMQETYMKLFMKVRKVNPELLL